MYHFLFHPDSPCRKKNDTTMYCVSPSIDLEMPSCSEVTLGFKLDGVQLLSWSKYRPNGFSYCSNPFSKFDNNVLKVEGVDISRDIEVSLLTHVCIIYTLKTHCDTCIVIFKVKYGSKYIVLYPDIKYIERENIDMI